jgi:hypothetical protein
LGHNVDLIEVSDGTQFNGRTVWTPQFDNHTQTPPERAVMVSVAGYVAELLVFGQADECYCATDKDQAWEAAAGHVVLGDQSALAELQQLHNEGIAVQNSQWPRLREASEVYQRLETECRSLLQANRADMDALAAYLEQNDKCKGNDIDMICSGKQQS